MSLINLIVVEKIRLFRKGLVSLLKSSPHIDKIDEAPDSCELFKLLRSPHANYNLIVVDYDFTDQECLKIIEKVKEQFQNIKVIALSSDENPSIVLPLLKAGVDGYLPKSSTPEELINAAVTVVTTGHYFSQEASQLMHQALVSPKNLDQQIGATKLKPREIQVLQLICMELTAAEIGTMLNLSVRTIEGYRKNLLQKTGCKNTAGLVIFAIANNLVNIEELAKKQFYYS